MLLSFPLGGRLHYHREEPDSWTRRTKLEGSCDYSFGRFILCPWKIDSYGESPFSAKLKLNSHELKANNQKQLNGNRLVLIDRLNTELEAISSSIPEIEQFVSPFNDLHNKLFAHNIEWRKSIRKKRA